MFNGTSSTFAKSASDLLRTVLVDDKAACSVVSRKAMEFLRIACQVVIGLGILNVWFLRCGKKTPYRGKDATNLKEEFAAYGLPSGVFVLVGILKVGAALALLAGIFLPALVQPAAIVMAVLMLGAITMHLRVGDPPGKSLPAAALLVLSLVLIFT